MCLNLSWFGMPSELLDKFPILQWNFWIIYMTFYTSK